MSDSDPFEGLSDNLANTLRQVRQARSLTQGQLAKLCGVPRSTIANLEAGGSNPTLSVLARLSTALHLSLEEMLSAPRTRCQLFPKGSLPMQTRGRAKKALVHKLLPHPIPGMEIDRFELQPASRIIGVPHRPGTHEYLYCETGQLSIVVTGETFELTPGDVAAFPGDQAHSYHNGGRDTAVGFSVVTLTPLQGAL